MAPPIHVAGLVTIQVATPAGGTFEDLGYSVDGVDIDEETFTGEVKCDDHGGEQGPPADVQYFGEVHTIRMRLSKWNATVMAKVLAGLSAGTAGVPGAAGTLYFQGGKTWSLALNSANAPRLYGNVIFHKPKSCNFGTKFSQQVIVATAYKDASGNLYTVSGLTAATTPPPGP